MPNYEELDALLEQNNLLFSAAELHGVICGLICGGISLTEQSWQSKLYDLTNDGDALPIAVKNSANQLFNTAKEQLQGDELSFSLQQPNDDAPIIERLQALTTWVQSYLVGFGILRSDLKEADADFQELIRDFSDISQLSLEVDSNDEGNEESLIEISEYVRLGAIACFEQFTTKKEIKNSPLLH